MMMYGETFYDRHTAQQILITACSVDDQGRSCMCLEYILSHFLLLKREKIVFFMISLRQHTIIQCHVYVLLLLVFLLRFTVELQWLEHLWDHKKLFETWVHAVRVTEG